LLIVAADRRRRRLADDCHNRHVIELCVIETVQQMNRARPRRCETHTDLARKFRVRAGHKRGHFFVPDLDELDFPIEPSEGSHNSVDAVARIAENPADPPFLETLEEEVTHSPAHRIPSLVSSPIRTVGQHACRGSPLRIVPNESRSNKTRLCSCAAKAR
jgi:hypothetical protein